MKNRVTPKMYLDMWLSEQIPTQDWLEILKERSDVKDLYHTHLEKKNGTSGHPVYWPMGRSAD